MRENIEQFSIMEDQDMLQKIMDIAAKCRPNECYGNTFYILLKKLAIRHLPVLEHGNAVFEVSREIYKNFRDLMQAMDEHDVYSRFRFTDFDGRYLMSGTFRDWYLLAHQLYVDDQKQVMARCGFDIVNESVRHVLDNFLDKADRLAVTGIKAVEPGCLTEKECLSHVRLTVRFIVSRDMSREFLRFREASIDEVPYPLPFIDPLFFSGGLGEHAIDEYLDATVTWEAVTGQAEKAYHRFIELGMTTEIGTPLMSAFSVVPGSAGTELYMTANLDHWQHIFRKAADRYAAYEMRDLMTQVSQCMYEKYPFMKM